jgi:hypothetical protein
MLMHCHLCTGQERTRDLLGTALPQLLMTYQCPEPKAS